MRICYLCADLGVRPDRRNGSAAHLRSVVGGLREQGHEVVFVGASDWAKELDVPVRPLVPPPLKEVLLEELQGGGGIVGATPRDQLRRIVRALGHIWNNTVVGGAIGDVLARERPDVVYERYSPFAVAGPMTARHLGVAHVLEVNAPLAWEGARHRGQALSEAAQALEDMAFALATRIIAVSDELRQHLVERGVDRRRIRVVPNGVDVGRFTPRGPAYRSDLAGRFVIGFVGSLKPWHGIDVLAEAFRRLADDPRPHLLVVGDGPQAGVLAELAADFPERVTLVRAVDHDAVPGYLRAMDVAVAPYPPLERFYFSPLKILEYMASGRAIVASRIGQVAMLLDHGATAWLVPPGDPRALADALRRLADDPALRHALGARAARAALAHDWALRVREIVDIAEGARGEAAGKAGARPAPRCAAAPDSPPP